MAGLEKEMATYSVPLPGESHGLRSLAGYSPQGHKQSETMEQLNTSPLFQKNCVHAKSKKLHRTSLVIQWLRSNVGDLGSIPGQEMRPYMPPLKIPHAATKAEDPGCYKTERSQINMYFLSKKIQTGQMSNCLRS